MVAEVPPVPALALHLTKDAVGDIIIAAPVGGALSVSELVHVMTVQLTRQLLRGRIDFAGAFHEMTATAVKFNLFNLTFCRTGRHDGNKWQP